MMYHPNDHDRRRVCEQPFNVGCRIAAESEIQQFCERRAFSWLFERVKTAACAGAFLPAAPRSANDERQAWVIARLAFQALKMMLAVQEINEFLRQHFSLLHRDAEMAVEDVLLFHPPENHQ
jgi:hypothetical protein